MQAKISVIIPVYNTETTLARCIQSVINQSLNNIEIILIDDGSDDYSGNICDEFARNHLGIIAIHQDNAGVSAARNKGIIHAKGKYIFFLDADDYIDCDLFNKLYDIAEQYELDVVESGYYVEYYNDSKFSKKVCKPTLIAYTIKELPSVFATMEMRYVWAKLFRKIIFEMNSLYFDEKMNYGEDLHFILRVICFIEKAGYIDICGYHYINNCKNSLSKKYVSNIELVREKINDTYKKAFIKYPIYEELYYKTHMSIQTIGIIQRINNLYRRCSPVKEYKRRQLIKNLIQDKKNLEYIDNIPLNQIPKSFIDKMYVWVIKTKSVYIIDFIFKIKEYLDLSKILK